MNNYQSILFVTNQYTILYQTKLDNNISLALVLGCYKREKDVSYVLDKVLAKQDNRPETFYFGQKEQDVDACEAACKDEPDCVAYTLYQVCVLY